MSQRTVVIIERASALRAALVRQLNHHPCEVVGVPDLFTGWRVACGTHPLLVVVGTTGGDEALHSEFARDLGRLPASPAIIFLSGSAEPGSPSRLAEAVAERLRHSTVAPRVASGIVGASALMTQARAYIAKVAQTACPVFIMGETGTGKELVARAIHECGARATEPFVALNCAAVPDALFESEMFGYERGAFTGAFGRREGRFAEANGGTLFLDEIGELSPCAQAKLLRVLESKKVEPLGGPARAAVSLNVRFVAATNRSIEELVKTGCFRRDLFYRLAVTRLELPPLRQRVEDIPALLRIFLEDVNLRLGRAIEGFDDETLAFLFHHTWPGNVRELKNLVEAVAVEKLFGTVTLCDIPAWFAPPASPAAVLDDERAALVAALDHSRWNKSRTASQLGWSRMKLYRKLAWHGLDTAVPTPKRDAESCSARTGSG